MATIAPPEVGPPPAIKTPMRAYLGGLHEQWLEEVRRVIDPARQVTAGTWLRWRAIEYLGTGFKRRLWLGEELVSQLLDGLGRRVGLCQREAEFAKVTLTLIGAVEYWCRQVEDALGPVRWGEVLPESRGLFETITYDDVQLGG